MAYSFDYSQSGIGQSISFSQMFEPVGYVLPDVYWSGPYFASGSYSIGGNMSETAVFALDARGQNQVFPTSPPLIYYEEPSQPYFPTTFANPSQYLTTSYSVLQGAGATDGLFTRFEGVASPVHAADIPGGLYDSYQDLQNAYQMAVDANWSSARNQLEGLKGQNLNTVGSIHHEKWSTDTGPSDTIAIFTPDATTTKTLGDLILEEDLGQSADDMTYAQRWYLKPTEDWFDHTDDVEVILTDFADQTSGPRFAARTLTIDARGGDDSIDVGSTGSETSRLPLNVVVDGGDGNDFIEVRVLKSAELEGGAGNDTIYAYEAFDTGNLSAELRGGSGHDELRGLINHANTFYGDAGNDQIIGGFGKDVFHGGDGNDDLRAGNTFDFVTRSLTYTTAQNTFYLGAGDDTVIAGEGDDWIEGGSGADRIVGLGGDDTLMGGQGRDLYDVSVNADNFGGILGTMGNDIIEDADGGVIMFTVSSGIDAGNLVFEKYGTDVLISSLGASDASLRIKDFYFTFANWETATLHGPGPNVDAGFIDFTALRGVFNASEIGTNAAETVSVAAGGSYAGRGGDDRLTGGSGSQKLFGGDGDDTLIGGSGNDTIEGGAGNDKAYSGTGADIVDLGEGNDYVLVGGGLESFDGGAGKDYLSYYNSSGGITVDLGANTVSGSWAVNDTIQNFESFSGSNTGGDKITGTTGSNTIRGNGGNDSVFALTGNDYVSLGAGNDYVKVGGGAETFLGGSGTDYISYYDSTGGISIHLGRNTVSGSWASNDTISSFEGASGSKTGGDTMIGSSAANTLRGYGGDDKFWGGSGADRLYGGSGNDWFDGGGGSGTDQIWGGSGADVFHFDRGDGTDIIRDFENNIDEIQLDNFGISQSAAFGFADQVGTDVVFDFGSNGMLTIENVTIGQLQNDLVMV